MQAKKEDKYHDDIHSKLETTSKLLTLLFSPLYSTMSSNKRKKKKKNHAVFKTDESGHTERDWMEELEKAEREVKMVSPSTPEQHLRIARAARKLRI